MARLQKAYRLPLFNNRSETKKEIGHKVQRMIVPYTGLRQCPGMSNPYTYTLEISFELFPPFPLYLAVHLAVAVVIVKERDDPNS